MSDTEVMGRVRLAAAVRSETMLVEAGVGKAADRGTYPFTMNQHGAVCILLADGSRFGVRPAEFEWERIDQPFTNRQLGAWLMSGKDPRPSMASTPSSGEIGR